MRYATTIGIDTHAKTNSICAIDTNTGDMREIKLSSDPQELINWIKTQDFAKPVMALYESGPTGFVLARALISVGIPCTIAAVSKLPYAKDKRKTDRFDARKLAKHLIANEVNAVWIPDQQQESLKNLSRLRAEAALDLRRAKQRVTSFMLLMGIHYTAGKRWTQKFRSWLGKCEFATEMDSYVFREKIAEVYHRERRLASIEQVLREAVAKDLALSVLAARLKCLHGIGDVTAYAFVCELAELSRFKNGRAFAAFLGLTPSENSSGEHNAKGSITKMGNTHLRRLLIEAASCYSRKSSLLTPEDPSVEPLVRSHAHKGSKRLLKRREALAKRGKQANKAKVAIARELAEWMYHVATM